jgi:hypothetical protein
MMERAADKKKREVQQAWKKYPSITPHHRVRSLDPKVFIVLYTVLFTRSGVCCVDRRSL